jgi:putative membrane protein
MTTLSSAVWVPFRANRTLQTICTILGLCILYGAARPESVVDFWLENILTLVFLSILAGTYRRLPLSDISYILILIFLAAHQWGAQYKYSDVPLGEWMKPALGLTRNHYDRVIHFAYGLLLAYPMQEWFVRSAGVRGGFRYFLPIQFTLACSAVYEILEAIMATLLSPQRGEEFVGMQGDIWDAQQDMFLAFLGSAIAMGGVAAVRRWAPQRTGQAEALLHAGTASGVTSLRHAGMDT